MRERGNLLFEILLLMSIVILFMPIMAKKLSEKARTRLILSTVSHVNKLSYSVNIYLINPIPLLKIGTTSFNSTDIKNLLVNYGLEGRYNFETPLGHQIQLHITRKEGKDSYVGWIVLSSSDSNLNLYDKTELVNRLGSNSGLVNTETNKIEGVLKTWETNIEDLPFLVKKDDILIKLSGQNTLTPYLSKYYFESNPSLNQMFTDIYFLEDSVDKLGIYNAHTILSHNAKFDKIVSNKLSLSGIDRPNNKIEIDSLTTDSIYVSKVGSNKLDELLSIGAKINVSEIKSNTITTTRNITAEEISMYKINVENSISFASPLNVSDFFYKGSINLVTNIEAKFKISVKKELFDFMPSGDKGLLEVREKLIGTNINIHSGDINSNLLSQIDPSNTSRVYDILSSDLPKSIPLVSTAIESECSTLSTINDREVSLSKYLLCVYTYIDEWDKFLQNKGF
ncbi:MAG: hypothetical protein JJV93_02780 [Alphaproteobacteria bacterium]|nr:hypothetical protein [Alphaproteobacteria bacterium]MBL0718153.1 hypothetical protein [Alphaproteobacteria bacterium]